MCDLFRLLLGEHLLVELQLLALQDVAVAAAGLSHTATHSTKQHGERCKGTQVRCMYMAAAGTKGGTCDK